MEHDGYEQKTNFFSSVKGQQFQGCASLPFLQRSWRRVEVRWQSPQGLSWFSRLQFPQEVVLKARDLSSETDQKLQPSSFVHTVLVPARFSEFSKRVCWRDLAGWQSHRLLRQCVPSSVECAKAKLTVSVETCF